MTGARLRSTIARFAGHLVFAALTLALLCFGIAPLQVARGQSIQAAFAGEEALVRAYVAAWNAGEAPRVALLFAPTAEVRQRSPWMEDGGDRAYIRDSYGTEMTVYFSALTFSGADILWARGRSDVLLWAAQHIHDGHRLEIDALQSDGPGRLSWTYRASTHAQRHLPGVTPTAGRAEATIVDGALRSLTFESDLPSAQARIRQILAAARYVAPADSGAAAEQSLPPMGNTAAPIIRVGPADSDASLIVAGSAAALLLMGVAAARGALRPRRR